MTAAAVLGLALLLGAQPSPQDGMARALSGYDIAGLSDDAAGSLYMAASIISGWTLFDVHYDPVAGFTLSYENGVCFAATATESDVARVQAPFEARSRPWFALMRALADADASGSVSDGEALKVRLAVELAFLAKQAVGVRTVEALVARHPYYRGRQDAVAELVDIHNQLFTAARDADLHGLPQLPPYLRELESTPR